VASIEKRFVTIEVAVDVMKAELARVREVLTFLGLAAFDSLFGS